MGKAESGSKEEIVCTILSEIYQIEQKHNSIYTVYDIIDGPKPLYEHFVKLKLLLRRIEFDLSEESELYVYTEQMHVSEYMMGWIIQHDLIKRQYICAKLAEAYGQKRNSQKAAYFKKLQAEVEDLQ